MSRDVDVAIVGAGGAGLSLLVQLALRGPSGLRVALIDPVQRAGNDRTWCFWDDGSSDVEAAVCRSWQHIQLMDTSGRSRSLDLRPMRYVMVRSADFYRLADQAAEQLGAVRLMAEVQSVRDGVDAAVVHTAQGDVGARWVFDSRPAPPERPGATTLLQHFRGWVVSTQQDTFEAELATLMDFSTPQPGRGLSFGYCLPIDNRRALLEYTEFSPQVLTSPAYDIALSGYAERVLGRVGLTRADVVVEEVENGVIPMSDARFTRAVGRRIFRLGTAGGATRGSTGYTFSAMQRQARHVATALAQGRTPVPPAAYPARHRWMDSVLLRALDQGLVDGPAFLLRLFERNPAPWVLRFLDGLSSPVEELAVMRSAPMPAMVRATARDAGWRLRQTVRRR